MGDPYRPSNYHQSSYQPSTYAPPAPDQYGPSDHYASGALATRHNSSGNTYYPQSNTQLTQSSYRPPSSDSKYLDPADSHRGHRSHSHSHSRRGSRDNDDDRAARKRSKSRTKEWGSTAVGAAAGGLIGNELGHGPLATIGGLVAGAYGAHELEKRHERHQEKKRLDGDDGRSSRGHHKRRSSGGLLDNVKGKVEGFLSNPDKDVGKRSRSNVGTSRKSTRDYDSYSDDGEYDDGYSRRSSKGGGRSGGRRDDYYY